MKKQKHAPLKISSKVLVVYEEKKTTSRSRPAADTTTGTITLTGAMIEYNRRA